jgi:hypothetical protein
MLQKSAIQVINLFGASGDLPDVVHCETIAARSVLHDCEFGAHRHARLHQVQLMESGGIGPLLQTKVRGEMALAPKARIRHCARPWTLTGGLNQPARFLAERPWSDSCILAKGAHEMGWIGICQIICNLIDRLIRERKLSLRFS